ncbi:SDR family oxidoreductase [Thiohalomonas denitrificans]|uniref:SDR family oxidoreductase n=1 Tax=Thiohalomonas denitrificans TaxID=415747 RepID=UPI0026ED6C69|nr:SDR family oxidoreductase [Thiohalomonas denitrificans]
MAQEEQFRQAAKIAAERQRNIQRAMDEHDQRSNGGENRDSAIQAGPHGYPEPPLPEQHLEKPGSESELNPPPEYRAPEYKGSGKLQGMKALITGGDSGIGRAVAVLYAREGADIAILYLDADEDARETKSAVENEGGKCLEIAGDVKDPAFCRYAVERTLEEYGRLDILVNNAAFQEHAASLDEISEEHFDETLRTNLYGYFHMAKAAVPHLKSGSSIINTGSETGIFGQPLLLDYSLTKGGIHAFTKALATNLIAKGIRVNAVAPGPVWTPLNPADRPPGTLSKFGATTDMKRPAQPEEVSPAYVFLAAPSCSGYITGTVIPVMGGVTGSA